MKKIGIIGARVRNSEHDLIVCSEKFLEIYEEGDEIVSGGCPKGGDFFAEVIAEAFGIPITIFLPDWDKHGKAAGFIRNKLISDASDVIIALVTENKNLCKGTMHTVSMFKKNNKEVILDYNEEEFDPLTYGW
jgi:hypothetical protein